MNKKISILAVMVILVFSNRLLYGDKQLETSETLRIFQKLTSQSRLRWLSTGTIRANHKEYKAPKVVNSDETNKKVAKAVEQYLNDTNKRELTDELQKMKLDAIPFNTRYELLNEYTMDSETIVKIDGEKFYWEINTTSRVDLIKPDDLTGQNFMAKYFDMNWNKRRIFVWDGQRYTTYFLPGNHAIIDSTGTQPHKVNGPLTAGIIPWGYGRYSYESLAESSYTGVEKYADGKKEIELTVKSSDGFFMTLILDSEKDYAVKSCAMGGLKGIAVHREFSDYRLISGSWVPCNILLEQYEADSGRLLTKDEWIITEIDGNTPSPDSFTIQYQSGALIENFCPLDDRPQTSYYSGTADYESLLGERLNFVANNGYSQNCATAALKHTLSRLGKNLTSQELEELVNKTDGKTTLHALKTFAEKSGFFCKAVKTNVETLKKLNGTEVILHIPGKKHFVVLDKIDSDYVWTIDLASNKFFIRTDISFFDTDWSEGVALLISSKPIELQGSFTQINDNELKDIVGSAGYSCTRLLQGYNVIFCTYVMEECLGMYQEYYTRYGCQSSSSGSCSSSSMIRYKESPCIDDPYNLEQCDITGVWTCYYMRACA
jgi:hypothetical protein